MSNVGKVFNLSGGGGSGSPKMESLTIATPPNKTVYKSGETFDPTGMVVVANYGEGLMANVTGYTVSPSVLTDGVSKVVITYTEGRITKTATVAVTVKKVLVSIAITTQPTKTVYQYQESLDPTGMVVTATFSDGSTAAVLDYTYPTTNFSTLGRQVMKLEYTYEGVTKSTDLVVMVQGKTIAVPTQTNIPTYNGSDKTPSWNGYDPLKMEISGVTSASDAGSYTAIFKLSYGYLFPDGTDEARVKWTIDRAVISALPTQTGTLVADGTSKTPSWNGYDTNKMTIGGDTSGTAAGEYTATFTPTSNYKWSDGSTGAKEVKWTIISVLVSIPSQSGTLTYNGSAQTPKWQNFDNENSSVSVSAKTNAGEYTATFTLKKGMWTDGTTAAKTIKWTIGRATIAAVPAQSGTLVYDGNPKTPSWNTAYDSAKMTVSVTAATNAGTYSATFTPTSNYKWSDGSTGGKTASWMIGKAANSVTNSPSSIVLKSSAKTATFTVNRKGNGTITATSNNTSVAKIKSINQSTGVVTVESVNDTTGTAKIIVKVAEGTNYKAASDTTVNVTATFVTIYGVEWDWTSSGQTKGTRTDAAASFGDPSPAVNNGSGSSPFDNLMPWSGMVKETRSGGVEVKEPKYWFKWTKTGKKLKLQIADGYVEGFSVDPVNRDRGDGLGELDYSYIGRYHCASGYKSTTGAAQQVNITRSQARSGIHNLGANFWQMDFAQFWYVNMLFLVEFADWNGERIGRGCSTNGSKMNNGQTDAMGYHTGTTAASRDSYGFTQYRNIEGWWDNVYDWMDGCYYNNNGLNVISNPNNFSDSANGTLVGTPSSGYPSDFTIPTASGLEWALFPSAANGSQTTYVPDNWYFSGSGPCLLHGGSYSQSQDHGPFCVDCYRASDSDDSIGCRLQERPPKAA